MDATEAIEIISTNPVAYPDPYAQGVWDEAIRMALSALKKQDGKKPLGTHYAHMKCPVCNHRIPSGMGSSSHRRDNWCNYCGQKIDWGVTE